MKWLIILFVLCSCSANWHLKRAIKKGLKPEVTEKIIHDSIFVKSDSIILQAQAQPDTIKIIQECDSLIKASPAQKTIIIKKIQKEACPQINKDSTFYISVEVQGQKFNLPIQVHFIASGGTVQVSIKSFEKKIPFISKEEINKYQAKEGIKWYWLIVTFLTGLIIAFILDRRK